MRMLKRIVPAVLVQLGGTLLITLTVFAYQEADHTGALSLKTLHSFTGQNGDGWAPIMGALYMDKNGALYGTTQLGGVSNHGTVFELSPPALPSGDWTESVIHSFLGSDGAMPLAALTPGEAGVLYGTTAQGGASNNGTVFQLTPRNGRWVESVLYSFQENSDGHYPTAAVIVGPGGELYGTTQIAGKFAGGTAFQLTPPAGPGAQWTETIIHTFTGRNGDGANPVRALVRDSSGSLYGTTYYGGASGLGVVFQLIPPALPGGSWTESILHSFSGGSDGAHPDAVLVAGIGGVLYGTTEGGVFDGSGNGTVFQMTPPAGPGERWTESVLYDFQGGADGANPGSSVSLAGNGSLYGTTTSGGSGGKGTVFVLKPALPRGQWTETILHSFTGPDGAVPQTRLMLRPGVLYGATVLGGSSNRGTVYALTP